MLEVYQEVAHRLWPARPLGPLVQLRGVDVVLPNFEVFLEGSLNFFFIPATDVDLGLALGGRFFF